MGSLSHADGLGGVDLLRVVEAQDNGARVRTSRLHMLLLT